jgi:alkylation response protein AidB-like acyl-CoA dehydrogenase
METLDLGPEQLRLRDELRAWLDEHLVGEFAEHLGVGGPDDVELWDMRVRWEKELAAGGWLGLTWPKEYGGRGASLLDDVVFRYEYTRSGAPYVAGAQGLDLFGPMLLHFGSEEQKRRFLPKILSVEEFWGQGFSEPEAGSDLAGVRTGARLEGDEWIIDGQKIWTTFGMYADWLYILCRTEPDAPKHRGLSLLIVPANAPGVEIRPILSMLGEAEFCEVFFTGARTAADLVIGGRGAGWQVAMGALKVERGAVLLPKQLGFEREADEAIRLANAHGIGADQRDRLVEEWIGVQLISINNMRTLAELVEGREPGIQATTGKLFASSHHQQLLEVANAIRGEDANVVGDGYRLDKLQRALLMSRAESIYGGTSQIQRTIIGERLLGLPKEPAPQ